MRSTNGPLSSLSHSTAFDRSPLDALVRSKRDGVLAVVTGVEGPSYRPVGAMMAILPDGTRAGSLSSGCIESDLVVHAMEALDAGVPRVIRYGRGSPYIDIQLPCGGGIDILLVPRPDRVAIQEILLRQRMRTPCALSIETGDGAMVVSDVENAPSDVFTVRIEPQLQFCVFGKGPEAGTFAALVQTAGYPNVLLSPDNETLERATNAGCDTRSLPTASFPSDLLVDRWTAIVLFFHDHDWEPPLLKAALDTPAFYIGAQGSRRARDARLETLKTMGVTEPQLDRLHGPVGLIPSARDAPTLAVSVLAEIMGKAGAQAP
ncbi:MAG: XdhC family protein [Pseudomonadota bacterium]